MVDQILESLSRFLPETILAAAFCLGILADLIFGKKPGVVTAVSLGSVLVALYFVLRQSGWSQSIFSGMIVVDPFSVFFKLVIGLTTTVVILFSLYSSEVQTTTRRKGEYFSLLLSLTLGMFLMAGAANLLMMVLALELTSLTSYVLAGYTKEASDSSEASLKYIIYGALSSGLMLYGISILYGLTGATDI